MPHTPSFRLAAVLVALALASSHAEAALDEVGTPSGAPALVATFGTEVPSKTALQQLVPEGWVVYVHRDIKLPPTLSWKAGQSWPVVVSELADKQGWAARVDWSANALYLKPGPTPVAAPLPPASAVPAMSPPAAAAQAQPEPVLVSGSGALKLDIAKGETLRAALERLAMTQGWTVDWRANRDFKAARAYQVAADSMKGLIENVVVAQGLSATVFHTERIVRIETP